VPRGQRDGFLRPYSRISRQELLLLVLSSIELVSLVMKDALPLFYPVLNISLYVIILACHSTLCDLAVVIEPTNNK
jgi:hypothetical protein